MRMPAIRYLQKENHMKSTLFLPILFCAIAFPALAELTPQDLDKIRLIVKEEVKAEITTVRTEIKALDTRLQNVEQGVSWLRGKIDSLDKHINWLMALIVVAVVIPQGIVAWSSRTNRAQAKQIEELAREIEILKQQRIVSP